MRIKISCASNACIFTCVCNIYVFVPVIIKLPKYYQKKNDFFQKMKALLIRVMGWKFIIFSFYSFFRGCSSRVGNVFFNQKRLYVVAPRLVSNINQPINIFFYPCDKSQIEICFCCFTLKITRNRKFSNF